LQLQSNPIRAVTYDDHMGIGNL